MADEPISITQGFLAQVLCETEQALLADPRYQSTGEVFNTAVYLLSATFRTLMETMADNGGYGVIGGTPDDVVKALAEIGYGDLAPEQKAIVDDQGRILEILMRDAPARIIITGLIEAYRSLEAERKADASLVTPEAGTG